MPLRDEGRQNVCPIEMAICYHQNIEMAIFHHIGPKLRTFHMLTRARLGGAPSRLQADLRVRGLTLASAHAGLTTKGPASITDPGGRGFSA